MFLTLSFTLLLALSDALRATTALYADPMHIPLARRTPAPVRDAAYYASVAQHLRGKYGYSAAQVPGRKRDAADFAAINHQSDTDYLGVVNIGTPSQNFSVILDTGTTDLWVASSLCESCNKTIPVFHLGKSISLKSLNSGRVFFPYGAGSVLGELMQDVVSMGALSISQLTFLAADDITTSVDPVRKSESGVLGLGFSPSVTTNNSKPFWRALADSGKLSAPVMSFWLNRFRDNPNVHNELGGIFTLGGVNTSLYTDDIEFSKMPVSQLPYWLLNLMGVTVQGEEIPITTPALSVIDTGTALIGGPTNDVKAIWATVPGSMADPNNSGFFFFPCTADVKVAMSFGSRSWPISTKDMNLGPIKPGSTLCMGAIFDLSQGTSIIPANQNVTWLIGAAFLKNVYSVFRWSPPSIGFANLSALADSGSVGTSGAASASVFKGGYITSGGLVVAASLLFAFTIASLLSVPFLL